MTLILVLSGVTIAAVRDLMANPLGTVLILSTSVSGGTSSPEAAAATADGYSVTVDTPSTWGSLSTSTFSSYSAIILGDPTCSSSASSSIGAAVSDVSTWSPAITGNVVIGGNSPVAGAAGANPYGATTFTNDAVAYALASGSGKTGLYVSLSCYYAAASAGTSVPVLSGLGTFTVGGGVSSSDSGTLNVPVEDGAPSFLGMTNSALLSWSASVQETFGTWPSSYQVLAFDQSATPSDFNPPGNLPCRPYVLINNATSPSSFAGAVGGNIPAASTFGESDPAAPGVTSGIATIGSGVNVGSGDYSTTSTDASAATYGPELSVDRTYDAELAQAQSITGTPGSFGYGWTSNLSASLSLHSPTSNDIYTTESGFNGPRGEAIDATGDIYVVDQGHQRVEEIAASSHTQWGISMTAGTAYTVAGGSYGSSGDGGPATSAELWGPEGVAVDSAGNLYIADFSNDRVQEVSAATGTFRGISMTAGDIYTIAGVTGTSGCTAGGSAATSTHMYNPDGLALDAAGDLYIVDDPGSRVLEVAATTHTQWGISMTANDAYDVAGQNGCGGGSSGDGGSATSAELSNPTGISVDGSGDLLISDSINNRIQEVAAASGTKWGISMTANHIYTIAGSPSGASGYTGDGGSAASSLLSYPALMAFDPAGNLYIADASNNRVQEIAQNSGIQWGISMTANDIYTVAGSATGAYGSSGDGGPNTAALLESPSSVGFDASGDLLISDYSNNKLREVVASAPSAFPSSPTPSGITVNQGDGAQVTFIPPVSGSCPSPYVGPGTTGTYCAPPYVTATLTYNSSTSTYTFITHPYQSYTFNSTGQLTSVTSTGGTAETLSYGSPSPGSGLCPSGATSCNTVTSASGRALVLGLNSQGLVTSVTDPLGNQWTYAYSGSNLTSVTDPMSRVTSYAYDSSNSNPLLVHDLLTVTSPNGQTGGSHAGAKLQNGYNSAGEITSQTDPGGNVTALAYGSTNRSTGNGLTITEDPDGNVSLYILATGIIDQKTIGMSTKLPSITYYNPSTTTLLDSSVVDPDGGTTSYTYNAQGDVLTTTNQLGQESTKSYNSFDQETCSTMPMAASTCASLSPPTAVTPGGSISPPSSAPPAFVTYTLYDTSGNQLWQTAGAYAPGASSASYSRTTYNLFSGSSSVTLGTTTDSCAATPPSSSLPCATIDADGNVTQLGYNSSGDVTSSSVPDGNGTELATTTNGYDADGNQTSTTAPQGNLSGANAANYTTTTTYDADHEALIVTLAGGTGATVPATTTGTYYDPNGNADATTDASGNPYSSSNTSGCNPNTTTNCAGTTYNTFNADNQQTLVQDPAGNSTLSCYDGDGNVAQTVPPSGVAAYSLSASSCPTSYPSAYSGTPLASDATMTTFGAQGKSTVVTAPPATGGSTRVTTTNLYDPAGQLIEATAPPSATSGGSNQVTTTTYDPVGHTTTQTTGFGTSASSTTSNCYDPDGDQTATVPGSGNTSGVATCQSTSPWGTSSAYQTASSFDSLGELVSTVSPPPAGTSSTATTSYTYDHVGNKTSMTDASGNTTTYSYNPLNVLVSTATSGQTSTDYDDADGNQVAVTAPGGNPYSAANPTGCNPVTTSTCSFTTYNTYNSSNELLTSTNADGQVTTNYYDTSGNKVATTGPSGNPGTCNPTTSSTPCPDTTTYTYNSLNQLTCQGQPNSANNTCASPGSGAGIVTYTYTSDGKRASMTDSTGTSTYSYDSSDRLISTINGAGATITYGYGQNSDPTCISYPNPSNNTCTATGSGMGIVTYAYNQANQPTAMSDWAGNTFAYSYNASGSVSNLSVNTGAVGIATSYDNAGSVASIDATASGGTTPLLNLAYVRQPNGLIASETPTVGSTTMTADSYGYDSQNQVTSGPITGSSGSNAYAYTASGAITQSTNTFASAGYDQAGELCWTSTTTSTNGCGSPPTGATSYSTNADGERALSQPSPGNSDSYAWDSALGTLSCANTNGTSCSTSSPTSSTSVYGYNGDGIRTSSTQGSTTTNFTWDPSTSPQSPRLISDGSWDYLYVPGGSIPVEQIAATGSSPTADLLLTDANGSVRGLAQLSSGTHQNQLAAYTDYDAYGNPISQSGGSVEGGGLTVPQTSISSNYVATSAFGFGEGYTDATGLIYLITRYYDPMSGQFMSIDPMVQQTQEPYQYADDDPANRTDPSGRNYGPYVVKSPLNKAFDFALELVAGSGLAELLSAIPVPGIDVVFAAIGDLSFYFSEGYFFCTAVGVAWNHKHRKHSSDLQGSCGVIVKSFLWVPYAAYVEWNSYNNW
jgi:RHS repeat-associated protein